VLAVRVRTRVAEMARRWRREREEPRPACEVRGYCGPFLGEAVYATL
jgi:hypothetical protein